MKFVRFIRSLTLCITLCALCSGMFAQHSILESYISMLQTQLSSATNIDQKKLLDKCFTLDRINTFFNYETLLKKENNPTPQFSCDFINPYLCAVINTTIKPVSDMGLVALSDMLTHPLQSTDESRYISMHQLINFCLDNEETATNITELLKQLNPLTSEIFINDIIHHWLKFNAEEKASSRWGKFKNLLSRGKGKIDTAVMLGSSLLSLGSWIPWLASFPLFGMANLAGYLPWCSWLSGIYSSCGNGLSHASTVVNGLYTATMPYYFNYNMCTFPISLLAPQNLTRDRIITTMNDFLQKIKSIAEQLQPIALLLPNTMTLTVPSSLSTEQEGITAFARVLKTLGYIDTCIALAHAIKDHRIFPVELIESSQNALETGTKILAKISSGSNALAQTWHNPSRSLVISARPQPNVSLNVLIGFILVQTLGIIQIHQGNIPTELPTFPLINPQRLIITTTTAYKNNARYEKLDTISIQ